jgi:hypothetical protein
MKTNHRRNFKAKRHRDSSMMQFSSKAQLADVAPSASIGNDFTNGNRGMAKDKRGAKKYVRSRVRFHDNMATKKLVASLPEIE